MSGSDYHSSTNVARSFADADLALDQGRQAETLSSNSSDAVGSAVASGPLGQETLSISRDSGPFCSHQKQLMKSHGYC